MVNLDECMYYAGAKNSDGYGRISVDGKNRPLHRVVYEATRGLIEEGLEADHLCENPPCFNPDHIEPVTHLVNARRGNLKRRGKYCRKGLHPMSGDNLREWLMPNGVTVARMCRQCNNDRTLERYHKLKKLNKKEL